MPKKLQPIDYTSRDFDSIRRDLENYAKRYYPNSYKDFNEASFGSLMLDTVSYIGDILSFYLDYQANESFLDTAVEYNNVIKLARQLGFKVDRSFSSFGLLTFYIKVPANTASTGPDLNYAPTLRAGSQMASTGGGLYTTLQDINFSTSTNQVVVGQVDSSTGQPTSYVIRAQGMAVSGRVAYQTVRLGNFERFRKVKLNNTNIGEVINVIDDQGHQYFEVNNLSQNVIFKAIRNSSATRGTVPNLLQAVPVPRRFVIETVGDDTFLQFGYGSDSELLSQAIVDPSNLMLDLTGRQYVTDTGFDPSKLISSDKFGIAPANTKLRISYRVNGTRDVNAATNTITKASRPSYKFSNQGTLSPQLRNSVVSSLEVTNEEPFVGAISLPTSDEIKERVFGFYATQHRAVTAPDYRALCYAMPGKFGAVKRASVVQDFDEFRRNLNLYVISEDVSGKLTTANNSLKTNLKIWINQYKMINDTVDIADAKIINFGIKYSVLIDQNANRYTVINDVNAELRTYFYQNQFEIGEPIRVGQIYKILNTTDGVVDAISVEITNKNGGLYSESGLDINALMSADGTTIRAPETGVFELKFPNVDIEGSIS